MKYSRLLLVSPCPLWYRVPSLAGSDQRTGVQTSRALSWASRRVPLDPASEPTAVGASLTHVGQVNREIVSREQESY